MATLLSLFDGSGGFPLAAAMCGITPIAASEVEPYPIAVTKSRFPAMRHLGDVSKIDGAKIEPVDIITFGSPCQDMSVAGKRAGIKHEGKGDAETTRSGLFMEAVRIIKEMRQATNGRYPAFAVWENVPGAFSSNRGEDFRLVLDELIKIVEPEAPPVPMPDKGWPYADIYMGNGWSIAYRTFDAQFWGVPQRRRRIYLVADFGGRRAAEILFKREGLRGHFEKGRTPWQGTSADVAGGAGVHDSAEGNCLTPWDVQSRRIFSVNGCWPSLYGGEGGGHGYVYAPIILDDQGGQQITVRTDGQAPTLRAEMHGNIPCVMQAAGFKAGQGAQARGIGWEEEKTPTLAAEAGGNSVPSVCVAYDARGNGDGKTAATITGDHDTRITDYTTVVCMAHGQANAEICENISPCLNCNHEQPIIFDKEPIIWDRAFYNQGANAKYDSQLYTDGICPTLVARGPAAVQVRYIVRRLTPTEHARLQGFPDFWGNPDKLEDMTDEDYAFWREVRNTHAAINGKAVKQYTKAQMLKWYNSLHTDSAEYKMWGNGIALPCALYVMQGIEEVYHG